MWTGKQFLVVVDNNRFENNDRNYYLAYLIK